jgi:EcsC protein family
MGRPKRAPRLSCELIAKVASRSSVAVSERFAAETIPVFGAAAGAAINLVFINYYQDMAPAHFTVRCLDRKYGAECIQSEYERIARGGEA